jgi:hypothetical protein
MWLHSLKLFLLSVSIAVAPFALLRHALQHGIGQFFKTSQALEPNNALTMKQNGLP